MNKEKPITLRSFFAAEKKLLILTAITGIIYNVGMAVGPLLEGQLAQGLYDILKGERSGSYLVKLSLFYVIVIAIVQGARALKRLYVRKFANNVSRSMKEKIYHHLVHESYREMQREDTGAIMTKALSDADACAEGMRKFTTEIYDTGVVMIAYLVLLFRLDWRLTFIVLLFPPIAYAASGALKKRVSTAAAESREAMSDLNGMAVDLVGHCLTYRVYGEDQNRSAAYETKLDTYEKKNVISGVWQNSPQPIYYVISMIGVIPILCLGGKNVLGEGWTVWTIAAFSSFLSCFTKLATKSSHAAKLFNAIQKAEVSWGRIKGYLTEDPDKDSSTIPQVAAPAELRLEHVDFSYEDGAFSLHDLNFAARPGEIIGITGRVASGKSTFGKLFLEEEPHQGKILFGGKEIAENNQLIFAYAGHDPELFTGTVRDNITFGQKDEERLREVLSEVQIDRELNPDTEVGREGSGLSGGQQSRVALARALFSQAPVLILDDPFAAVDTDTEKKIFAALREKESWRIILLISHRMALFPQMDQIIFLDQGTMKAASHGEMMESDSYAALYALQQKGGPSYA